MSDKLEAPFVREERYIVIKRKRLSPEHEDDIRELLASRDTPTIECVVVESDWPEYDTVWKMIEDRVNGREGGHRDAMVRAFEASGWSHFLAEKQADIALSVLRTPTPEQAGEVGPLREAVVRLREWLASLTVTDMNEIVADGGITAGMVVGQEAIEQLRRIDAALQSTPPAQLTEVQSGATAFHESPVSSKVAQPTADAVERLKAALHDGDRMESVGVMVKSADLRAILTSLGTMSGDYVMVPRKASGAMAGLIAYVTGLPEDLRWTPEFTRYVSGRFDEIAAMLSAASPTGDE